MALSLLTREETGLTEVKVETAQAAISKMCINGIDEL